MKYLFNWETDTDKVGNVDGIQSSVRNIDDARLLRQSTYNKLEINEIDFITLDSNAIITDVISMGNGNSQGLLCSKRFCHFLNNFNLPNSQFIKANIRYKDTILPYFFYQFYGDYTLEIDYSKTLFQLAIIKIADDNEYEDLKNQTRDSILEVYRDTFSSDKKIIPRDKYFFNKNVSDIDILRIGRFDNNFYFSEKLVNEINKHDFTGFYFIESDYFE